MGGDYTPYTPARHRSGVAPGPEASLPSVPAQRFEIAHVLFMEVVAYSTLR